MTTTPGLGKLELAVLMSTARLGDEAYGLRIRREVSALHQHDCSVGAIYTTLSRLEAKGLVDSWMTDPLPVRGGRSRRQYRITSLGESAVREAAKLAARLWDYDLGVDPA